MSWIFHIPDMNKFWWCYYSYSLKFVAQFCNFRSSVEQNLLLLGLCAVTVTSNNDISFYVINPRANASFLCRSSTILSFTLINSSCRSQWPRSLRRTSAAAHLLRSWIQIPPGTWMFVCCECCVLSGRGLCDELITRPEESYRLWCIVVCDLETSRIGAPYIWDISSLRVNDLTLILLTWRKWWANNASK